MCTLNDIAFVILTLPIFLVVTGVLSTPNPIPTTLEGAKLALANIGEWGKWMAGIQTAGIAALAYLVFEKDSTHLREMTSTSRYAALVGFVYSGAALFCSAWVLSALPSHSIRICGHPDGATPDVAYDVYELPLYGFPSWPRLGYLLAIKHWLWGIGLLAIGIFTLTLFASPSASIQRPSPELLNCSEMPTVAGQQPGQNNADRILQCIPVAANVKK